MEMALTTATALAAETPAQPVEARQDRRRQLLWSGVLQTARGPGHCIVIDISHGGARVSRVPSVDIGQAVTLLVTGLGMFRGKVAWAEPDCLGIAFAPEYAAGSA